MSWSRNEPDNPNPRDHGLPEESTPKAPPEIVAANPERPCANCECLMTFDVLVWLSNPELGDCWGHYVGCAACAWAGAMIVTKEKPEIEDLPGD